ncbi:hypothetical protein [Paenibacillus solani]|uniref:hypothetical protein n=1 Tax=Paenibacillus solani TaxID=1705565 RepID=UPI0013F4E7FB|nr:hypothetical protein [Paenibacillus solani]
MDKTSERVVDKVVRQIATVIQSTLAPLMAYDLLELKHPSDSMPRTRSFHAH